MVRWIKFGPIYNMLNLQSRYLKELGDFRALAPRAVATTVASWHDLVVYPVALCHLDGARQVTLETISHLGLMTQERVLDVVERALTASSDSLG